MCTEHYKAIAHQKLSDDDLRDRDYFLQKALDYDRSRGVTDGHPEASSAPRSVSPLIEKTPDSPTSTLQPETTENVSVKTTTIPPHGIVETIEKDIKTTTIPPHGIVETIEKDIKTTTNDNKMKEDKYINIGRTSGGNRLGPAPQLGTPEAKFYGAMLRVNHWLPVQQMWNSANQDVAMGRKGAEYEQKKMAHLAGLINNKDPQVHEVARKYGLELHPDWMHWAREIGIRRC